MAEENKEEEYFIDKAAKTFISQALIELISNNVGIKLIQEPSVLCETDGSFVSGFFDAPTIKNKKGKVELVVAIGRPFLVWFKIFIHEYCHYLQYKEQSKIWKKEGSYSTGMFWDWVLKPNKRISKKKALEEMKIIQELEIDCEKRTVALIKKNKLQKITPIELYIKQANAYIWFYNYIFKYRVWYEPGKEPPNIPEIIEAMPDNFEQDYNTLPKEYERLVTKHCFSGNNNKKKKKVTKL